MHYPIATEDKSMREPTRPTQRRTASLLFICICGVATSALAQSPPVQSFQGCVQPSPTDKTVLIVSTENACAKLTGKFKPSDITGHQVELKGVLTPYASATAPASIKVDSVVSVGKPCEDICSLQPPHTRGLGHGGETPGKEGGTPGAVPNPPPPPQ
jgi:hypothetical protein